MIRGLQQTINKKGEKMESKKLTTLVILISVFMTTQINAQTEYTIEVRALNSQIKVGEPLLLKITYNYQMQNISERTGEVRTQRRLSDLWLKITRKDETEESKYEIWPVTLHDDSGEGLKYSGWTTIFWGELERIFIFNEPSNYNCRIAPSNDKVNSNTIEINVLPASDQEKKAMYLLKD